MPVILLINFGGGEAGESGDASAGGRRHPRTRLGLCDGRVPGHSARSRERLDRRRHRADVSRRTSAAGAWRMGHDRRWAWGVSRIIDYLETDKARRSQTDCALRVFTFGQDRAVGGRDGRARRSCLSACAGEMGSALARRDWGETVDDMAENFPWQFAGNFQKYVGRWNDMPVDAHMLIRSARRDRCSSRAARPISRVRCPRASFPLGKSPRRPVYSAPRARRTLASSSCPPLPPVHLVMPRHRGDRRLSTAAYTPVAPTASAARWSRCRYQRTSAG